MSLTKLPISKVCIATLVKMNYFMELFFMSKDELYCVKGNVYKAHRNKSFSISPLLRSSHWEALSIKDVPGIWKNNSKLHKSRQKQRKTPRKRFIFSSTCTFKYSAQILSISCFPEQILMAAQITRCFFYILLTDAKVLCATKIKSLKNFLQ